MNYFFKNKDKNFNELLKGSSISLLLKVCGMAIGYASMMYITNFYGAETWGAYSLSFTILSIAILLPKFGFDNALVRIITELNTFNNSKEIIKVLLKASIIASILSFIVIVLIYLFSETLVLKVLNQKAMTPFIKPIGYAILPMVYLVIIATTFQALKKPMFFILFQTTLINIVFLILLIVYKSQKIEVNVFELFFYAICVTLIIAIAFLATFFIKKPRTPILTKKNYSYKSIVNISLPMLFSSSFALLMGWSDIIMLSYYKTTTDIGIYNASLKLAALSGITLIAINAIATPKIVEFYSKNDIEGLKSTVQKSTKMIFVVTTPILLILILFSKEILSFFGEEFIIGYLALIYLCVSRFVNAISGSVGYIMQMTDQQKTYQNIIIIAFFINLVLNFILIPKYSYNGAAIASGIAMIFWNISLVLIIKKKLGFWTIYIPFLVR